MLSEKKHVTLHCLVASESDKVKKPHYFIVSSNNDTGISFGTDVFIRVNSSSSLSNGAEMYIRKPKAILSKWFLQLLQSLQAINDNLTRECVNENA